MFGKHILNYILIYVKVSTIGLMLFNFVLKFLVLWVHMAMVEEDIVLLE